VHHSDKPNRRASRGAPASPRRPLGGILESIERISLKHERDEVEEISACLRARWGEATILKLIADGTLPIPRGIWPATLRPRFKNGCLEPHPDLPRLIEIARQDLLGKNPHRASQEIAQDLAGPANQRNSNHKRLYDYYNKHATIYLELAKKHDINVSTAEILMSYIQMVLFGEWVPRRSHEKP